MIMCKNAVSLVTAAAAGGSGSASSSSTRLHAASSRHLRGSTTCECLLHACMHACMQRYVMIRGKPPGGGCASISTFSYVNDLDMQTEIIHFCRRVHTDPACSRVITFMPTALARHLSDQVAESDGQAPGTFLYKLRLAAFGVIVRVLN